MSTSTLTQQSLTDRQKIRVAIADCDNQVLELAYRDSKGKLTRRVVSPIRFVAEDRFMALCLCREAPRVFYLSRCESLSLREAWQYVMPVAMEEIEG